MIRLRAGDKKNGIFGLAIEDERVEEAVHNLIGYHNTRVLLVVDEAQGTREAIFQACDNIAKNPEFKALLLGNAIKSQATQEMGKSHTYFHTCMP